MRGILISLSVVIGVVLLVSFTNNPFKQMLINIIEESEHPPLQEVKELAVMDTVTHFGKVETNLLEGVGNEVAFQGFKNNQTALVVTKKDLQTDTNYVAIFAGKMLEANDEARAQITSTVEGFGEFVGKPEKIEVISTHEVNFNNGNGETELGTFYKVMFSVRGEGYQQKVLSFVNKDGQYIHTFAKGHKKLEDF
jgi:hypothetical protein